MAMGSVRMPWVPVVVEAAPAARVAEGMEMSMGEVRRGGALVVIVGDCREALLESPPFLDLAKKLVVREWGTLRCPAGDLRPSGGNSGCEAMEGEGVLF